MKKDKQADAFEWDGDEEERFAMEKVHGLNDFDDNEQGKFHTMDNEVNGDDDWRALASQAQTEVENAIPSSNFMDIRSDAHTMAQETQPEAGSSLQNFPLPPPVLMGEMQLVDESGSSGIRIMRFTRKKTSFQRGRRPVLVQPNQQDTEAASMVVLEKDIPQVDKSSPSTENNVTPNNVYQVERNIHVPLVKAELDTTDDPKCVLVKARSIEDVTAEKKQVRKLEGSSPQGKKNIRPNDTNDHQQNKKPKALAFQKSRNIINKRMNVETVKPEPAMNVDCLDVKAVQEKYSSAVAEWKSLQEEVKSAAPKDVDAVKELPMQLHSRWLSSSVKRLGAKFEVQFAAIEHFLSHQHHHCSKAVLRQNY